MIVGQGFGFPSQILHQPLYPARKRRFSGADPYSTFKGITFKGIPFTCPSKILGWVVPKNFGGVVPKFLEG